MAIQTNPQTLAQKRDADLYEADLILSDETKDIIADVVEELKAGQINLTVALRRISAVTNIGDAEIAYIVNELDSFRLDDNDDSPEWVDVATLMASDRKLAVVALCFNGQKYLAVSRKDDSNDFGFPGGKVDPGETPRQALRREFREETGMVIDGPLWPIYNRMVGDTRVLAYSVAEGSVWPDETATVRNPDETGIIKWVDVATLKSGSFGAYNAGAIDRHAHSMRNDVRD